MVVPRETPQNTKVVFSMIDSEAVEAGGGHRMGQGWVSLQPPLSVELCVWPPQEVKASVLLYQHQWG